MAHSTDAYLVDAEGQLRHHIFFGAGADLIAQKLREVVGERDQPPNATEEN
jgi:cytochrome oxidase Cu insertion factor (SCO1/SenC/PrrC family)